MLCYLCSSQNFFIRPGTVREGEGIKVLECDACGLVTLSDFSKISDSFYENSQMHGAQAPSIESWLRDCALDDQRRFKNLETLAVNADVLDFGCGAGGFLSLAQKSAAKVVGVELETRVGEFWRGKLDIYPTLDDVSVSEKKFDLITAFHVIEHLADPKSILSSLKALLKPGGRIIVEVPNADDALISLYDCQAFQNFTYWSQHLYLFNSTTLKMLVKQSGMEVLAIEHIQRYPLSNHLFWLANGMPGGHSHWGFLDSPPVRKSYEQSLAKIGKTDTVIAHITC